jgi:hypothetical protein
MMIMLPDYAQAILNSNLPNKEQLAQLVRPAITVHSRPAAHDDPLIGVSRLGGLPDLSPALEWPVWQGQSQSFIAQINLLELPEFSERDLLPRSGMLFFFYDAAQSTTGSNLAERGSFAVIYRPQPETASRPGPAGLRQAGIFKPALLSFSVVNSHPGFEHPALARLGLSFEQCLYDYSDVIRRAEEGLPAHRGPYHQILGHPGAFQTPVGLDCERAQRNYWELDRSQQAELKPLICEHAEEWELLLQVDCDFHAGIDWPLTGCAYYMIRRQDLAQAQFDRAWLVIQMT